MAEAYETPEFIDALARLEKTALEYHQHNTDDEEAFAFKARTYQGAVSMVVGAFRVPNCNCPEPRRVSAAGKGQWWCHEGHWIPFERREEWRRGRCGSTSAASEDATSRSIDGP